LNAFLDRISLIGRDQEALIRSLLRDRAHPTTRALGSIEEQNLRVGTTPPNLLRALQRDLHDGLSTGHDRMLGRRDEMPPLVGDANPEAQRSQNLEEKVRIRFHMAILHVTKAQRVGRETREQVPVHRGCRTIDLEILLFGGG